MFMQAVLIKLSGPKKNKTKDMEIGGQSREKKGLGRREGGKNKGRKEEGGREPGGRKETSSCFQ